MGCGRQSREGHLTQRKALFSFLRSLYHIHVTSACWHSAWGLVGEILKVLSAEVSLPVSHPSPMLLFLSHFRKYSLIQDQARELTRLRQKVRLGGAVSSLLVQHVKNTVKNFEELLRGSKLDLAVGQHFREQLASGKELAESLAGKFSTGELAPGPGQTFSPSHGPGPTRAHSHPQVTFQSGVLLCNRHLGALA